MREVDTRGFSCPQPVLMFHEAVKDNADEPLDVLVDNQASLENVTRAAQKKGYQVTAHDVDGTVTRLELRR